MLFIIMRRCFNCGDFANHLASKCPQAPMPKRCHNCKSPDHLIEDCPTLPPEKKREKEKEEQKAVPAPAPAASKPAPEVVVKPAPEVSKEAPKATAEAPPPPAATVAAAAPKTNGKS